MSTEETLTGLLITKANNLIESNPVHPYGPKTALLGRQIWCVGVVRGVRKE
jgi:hypothetical protein